MDSNVLSILGVAAKEDVISNLLCHCLEVWPAFRVAFLRVIASIDITQGTSIQIFTRLQTVSSGVPDLVIAAETSLRRYLIIVENKLKADEGQDQTERYASPECVRDLKRRLKWENSSLDEIFVFLTLFPDQEPKANTFRQITYRDLLPLIRDLPPAPNTLADLLFRSWIALLDVFYSKASVAAQDILLDKLQEYDPLEGNYLYFKAFIAGLPLSYNLRVESTFRSSAQGRRFFGAQISKASWHPGEMRDGSDFDGTRHFHVHFEPQFDYLNGILNVYLHYEVNPYQPLNWVTKHIPSVKYDVYCTIRDRVVEALRLRHIPEFVIGGRSNQIGKAKLELKGATVSQARELIASAIGNMAAHIDQILSDSHGIFTG